jgi:hypothetical protein
MKLLDQIEIDIGTPDNLLTVYIDVMDHSLSQKWLVALNHLVKNNYHLEKNYCFFGFVDGDRNGKYILEQINQSIAQINLADIGYTINDHFTLKNTLDLSHGIIQDKFNHLHRYFEDLQGTSTALSPYYINATHTTRWHIRQLNLLCHEFESWALSFKKQFTAPEWQRPSQLMCWLNAPRFALDENDYETFGIESMNRPLGGVFVGVNKAIGKHHWEVFVDEANYNPDILVDNLITTTMRGQTEAAGDFDIEWGNNPGNYSWHKTNLANFRKWLINNKFNPDDKKLTIGHPQVAQVDLIRSFGTDDYWEIWSKLGTRLNIWAVRTNDAQAIYPYLWSDPDYMQQQVARLQKGN